MFEASGCPSSERLETVLSTLKRCLYWDADMPSIFVIFSSIRNFTPSISELLYQFFRQDLLFL